MRAFDGVSTSQTKSFTWTDEDPNDGADAPITVSFTGAEADISECVRFVERCCGCSLDEVPSKKADPALDPLTAEGINRLITRARRALQSLENEMIEAGVVGPRDSVAAAERLIRNLDARGMTVEAPLPG